MAKKRDYNDIQEELDNFSEEAEGYDNKAYLPIKNEKTGKYEMLIININLKTKKTLVEVEETRYDSDARALQDVMRRYTDYFFKKDHKRRK